MGFLACLRLFNRAFCYILITAFSVPVVAAKTEETSSAFSAGSVALNVVGSLIFVTVLILLLAWVLKRLGGAGFSPGNGMKVVTSLALGTREKLVLVEVEDKRILIGVSPGGISQLHAFDISDSPSLDSDSELEPSEEKTKTDFSQYFAKLIKDGVRS